MDGSSNTQAGTTANHQNNTNVGQVSSIQCTGCGAQNNVVTGSISKCEFCGIVLTSSNTPNTGVTSTSLPERAIIQPLSGPIHSDAHSQPINLNVTVAAPIQPQTQFVQSQPYRTVSDKSRGIALLLCILLGFFGGHMFYVGRSGMGLFYLFTLGGFMFGVIVDFFRILGGSFKDCDGVPLRNW